MFSLQLLRTLSPCDQCAKLEFVGSKLQDLVQGEVSMTYLIIPAVKVLRGHTTHNTGKDSCNDPSHIEERLINQYGNGQSRPGPGTSTSPDGILHSEYTLRKPGPGAKSRPRRNPALRWAHPLDHELREGVLRARQVLAGP